MVEEIEQYFKEELLIGDYRENLSSDFKLYISVEELIENKDEIIHILESLRKL